MIVHALQLSKGDSSWPVHIPRLYPRSAAEQTNFPARGGVIQNRCADFLCAPAGRAQCVPMITDLIGRPERHPVRQDHTTREHILALHRDGSF
jgi:hypothetical protein